MSNIASIRRSAAVLIALLAGAPAVAMADDFSNAASYNHGYDMGAGEENQSINPTLRDSNGNLTNVNGQFTSSSFSSQSGSSSSLSNLGNHSSGAAFNGATAIGNQLNVVTVGNFNTVIVSSHQDNTGTVTATVNSNASK